MRIAIRADASANIGTGHISRTLTLANELSRCSVESVFVCRQLPDTLRNKIIGAGHRIVNLPKYPISNLSQDQWLHVPQEVDAEETRQTLHSEQLDWLIVDQYGIDADWEVLLRPLCRKLMVIDDLANRKHDCDLLLDQTLNRAYCEYESLISSDSVMLLGPNFALLRPEFSELREYSLARRAGPKVNRVLISLGGTDPQNITGELIAILENSQLLKKITVQVVLGSHAPALDKVRRQISGIQSPMNLIVDTLDMARLLSDSDLVIGAAGISAWERCSLGVPSLVIVLAENQMDIAQSLNAAGASINLGSAKSASFEHDLIHWMSKLIDSPEPLAIMRDKASIIVDGSGASRVVEKLIELS